MNSVSDGISASLRSVLNEVADAARQAGVFGDVEVTEGCVSCAAAEAPEPVFYRISLIDGSLYVEWVTPDRWLSQSIEAELVFTGDDLSDMIDEELVDTGYDGDALGTLEHFRSEAKLYTFRSTVPVDATNPESPRDVQRLTKCLIAYELTFRELGDMTGDDDE